MTQICLKTHHDGCLLYDKIVGEKEKEGQI